MTTESTPAKVRLSDQLGHADEVQPPAWEHLKAYGYAPGGYMGRCRKCGDERIDMDKRAITCRACAERLHGIAMVAAERERCAAWLRWYDRAETRRSEAISNGDHWAPDLALGPNDVAHRTL